jgi:hypothetical protein
MQPGNPVFVNRINAPTSFFGGSGRGAGPGLMAGDAIRASLLGHPPFAHGYRHGVVGAPLFQVKTDEARARLKEAMHL